MYKLVATYIFIVIHHNYIVNNILFIKALIIHNIMFIIIYIGDSYIAERNYFINRITELLILSILERNDSYVYEIKKIIEDNSNHLLSISPNTIYAATYKLMRERLLSIPKR